MGFPAHWAGPALGAWGPGMGHLSTCRSRQRGPSGVRWPAGSLPGLLGCGGADHTLGASHRASAGWEAWAGEEAQGLDLLGAESTFVACPRRYVPPHPSSLPYSP